MTFVIDVDNNITAYANAAAPGDSKLKLSEHLFVSERNLPPWQYPGRVAA
jgi:hypothetical protein